MSSPFMQLYVGDYLRDTRHLTAEQHGAYLLLLMAAWNAGGKLPNDARKLARLAACSASRWAKIAADVLEFFDVEGDHITNRRLTLELKKASEKSIKRAEAGMRGGNATALKTKDTAAANAAVLPQHSSEPEPEKKDREAIASLVQNLGIAIGAGVDALKAAKTEAAKAFDGRFRAFWAAYPRRVKKPDALKAYAKAEARIGEDALRVILEGIERALPGWDNPKFIPHPATWLNACQWEDDAPATIIPLRIGHDQSSPDRKYDAKQSNYAAALTGSEWADQVLAARRAL